MILVLNCGSQSIKWKIFDKNLNSLKEEKILVLNSKDYIKILEEELKRIKNEWKGIKKIGHRVVHGGERFFKPTILTGKIIKEIEKLNRLAPLHNPFNLLGIKIAERIFPSIKQIAVFDTGFFKDIPLKAKIYALPQEILKKFHIRRYGFHGISHEYVAREASKILKKPFEKLKIITCHLGGGSSITAIKNGKPIDTSMGFTPLEGLVMMTRCGNIDPGIILEMAESFSIKKIKEILNLESGLKGICGESEMLKILEKIKKNDKNAKLAFEIFVYSIKKYIGAYFAILGGCDALVFTGAIGAGKEITRIEICKDLHILKETKVLVIKTDEEKAIAKKILLK